jgi:hypothetical protein
MAEAVASNEIQLIPSKSGADPLEEFQSVVPALFDALAALQLHDDVFRSELESEIEAIVSVLRVQLAGSSRCWLHCPVSNPILTRP